MVRRMAMEGGKNDMLDRIEEGGFFPYFDMLCCSFCRKWSSIPLLSQKQVWDELDKLLDLELSIGRSAEVVER